MYLLIQKNMAFRDQFMEEVEKIAKFLAALAGLKREENKEELDKKINEAYKELFDLNAEEITIENEKIASLLSSKDTSKLFLKKLEQLFELIELDYTNSAIASPEKKKVLCELLNTMITVDKTFSKDRNEKLTLYS